MQTKMLGWDNRPRKEIIREFKLNTTFEEAYGGAYLGLPGDTAILEEALAKTKVINPGNMFLAEMVSEVFGRLKNQAQKSPHLKGCNLFHMDIADLILLMASGKTKYPKLSSIDLDYCFNPTLASILPAINLAKYGLLADHGILFMNLSKGRDNVQKNVNKVLRLDSLLAEQCGFKQLSEIPSKRKDRSPAARLAQALRKEELDVVREDYIPNLLTRKYIQYGYLLRVKPVDDDDHSFFEYSDSGQYMQQWTFVFDKVHNIKSLGAYKANSPRRVVKYRKILMKKVKKS